jgi:hypothetical protein
MLNYRFRRQAGHANRARAAMRASRQRISNENATQPKRPVAVHLRRFHLEKVSESDSP